MEYYFTILLFYFLESFPALLLTLFTLYSDYNARAPHMYSGRPPSPGLEQEYPEHQG